jgi:hypothetical protein
LQYDQPFADDDEILIANLTIAKDNGQYAMIFFLESQLKFYAKH